MAKIAGWFGIAAVLIGLACLAADGVLVGLMVVGIALALTALFVHLVGMTVYGEWWPWRHL